MKNSQKGFIIPLIIIIAALVVGGGSYFYFNHPKAQEQTSSGENSGLVPTLRNNEESTTTISLGSEEKPKESKNNKNILSYLVDNSTLKVFWNGELTQTLNLEPEGLRTWTWAKQKYSTNAPSPFITNKDINFDGYNDVGMINMGGYNNENYTWNFYLFNSSTKKLESSQFINEYDIHIPTVDPIKKQIVVPMANGYYDIYQWTGSEFSYLCPPYSPSPGKLTKELGGLDCYSTGLDLTGKIIDPQILSYLNESISRWKNSFSSIRNTAENIYVRDSNSYQNVCNEAKTSMINYFNQGATSSSQKIANVEEFKCVANKNHYAISALLIAPDSSLKLSEHIYCLDSMGFFDIGTINQNSFSCQR